MSVLRLRADNVFWRESGGAVVALDADGSRYLLANPSAAELWKRLAGGATEADLIDALCDRFDVPPDAAQRDVAAFLAQLSERGLLAT